MVFKNSWISVFAGTLFLLTFLVSCEEDLDTLGDGVLPSEPFNSDVAEYDVFAVNRNINAVQTNRLPIYQVGSYDDPIFGRREAIITSQLTLPSLLGDPTFGNYRQSQEDTADSSTNDDIIPENETVKRVLLYLPYQLAPGENADGDNDGIPDELEAPEDRDDPESDFDNDGATDFNERRAGTDPFNPDTDGDGILDGDDDDNGIDSATIPNTFALDSIFSARFPDSDVQNQYLGEQFTIKVERSSFFLRDLDPDFNFERLEEYFSNTDIPSFVEGDVLCEELWTIDNKELLELGDNPETEDEVEEDFVLSRRNPGILVELDTQFFQDNILDKEGSQELLSQSNFSDFIRGLHISITPENDDLMLLLNLAEANITITYEFQDRVETDGEVSIETAEGNYVIGLLQNINQVTNGNAVNTFIDEPYSGEITSALGSAENANRIYLKGGSGTYAELNLFGPEGGPELIQEIQSNNWVINEANLIFHVDRETLDNAGGTQEPTRLYLYNAETGAPIYNIATEQNLSNDFSLRQVLNYDGILERGNGNRGSKYTVRITEYLNDIILRDSVNVPLRLVLTSNILTVGAQEAETDEVEEVDIPVMNTVNPMGTVLFGNNVPPADEDKKLKLQIFYTQPN